MRSQLRSLDTAAVMKTRGAASAPRLMPGAHEPPPLLFSTASRHSILRSLLWSALSSAIERAAMGDRNN